MNGLEGQSRGGSDEAEPELSITEIGDVQSSGLELASPFPSSSLRTGSGATLVGDFERVAGAHVDRFELCALLGKGGFGEVWKCRDPLLDRFVAIKFSRRTTSPSGPAGGLVDEARKVSRLSHPGIVHIYDVLETADGVAIVSELIDGQTLKERLASDRILIREVVSIVRDIAAGLQHAHQHDLVHRDVKPSNILIRRSGSAALTDFGLAASENQFEQMRDPSSGTLYFMSPEQARGDITLLDNRSDIFCLGIVLFHSLTGRYPYPSASDKRTYMRNVATRNAKSLRAVDSQLPKALDQICARCLALDPRERYRTAQDLVDDLDAFLNTESGPLPSASSPQRSRLTVPVGVFAATLAVIATLAGIRLFSSLNSPSASQTETASSPELKINEVNLVRYPQIFAWPYSNDRGTPQHSPETQTFSVASPTSRLVAVCGQTDRPELNLQVQFKLNNWTGAAGLFWGLRQNPDSPAAIEYLCYAVEFLRTSPESKPVVCVSELTLKPLDHREMQIPRRREIAHVDVSIPTELWATLKVSVHPEQLTVALENEEICTPVDPMHPEKSWLPQMTGQHDPTSAGVLGQSAMVAFRRLECF
jgi:serine/threonine protein kinase